MEKGLFVFGHYEDGTGFNSSGKFAKIVSALAAVSRYSNGEFFTNNNQREIAS